MNDILAACDEGEVSFILLCFADITSAKAIRDRQCVVCNGWVRQRRCQLSGATDFPQESKEQSSAV